MQNQSEIKLGDKLSELLTESDSSSAEIARKTGVSPASISQYRKGETRPSLETLVALARALNVSLDYLVLGESNEAEEVTVGPLAKHMDEAFQETQIRTAEHTALVAHVGRQLSQMLDNEIDRFLSEDSGRHLYAGLITDTETQSLEEHSRVVRLILRDFSYNMSSADIPGSFFATVANNLSRDIEYEYLLAENADIDWPSRISDFRTLLIEQTNSETAVRDNCSFRMTNAPIFSGYALYHLSEETLKQDDPILHEYIHENDCVDDDGWFGYLTPPAHGGRGEPVMDEEHLTNALTIFESLWREADRI